MQNYISGIASAFIFMVIMATWTGEFGFLNKKFKYEETSILFKIVVTVVLASFILLYIFSEV